MRNLPKRTFLGGEFAPVFGGGGRRELAEAEWERRGEWVRTQWVRWCRRGPGSGPLGPGRRCQWETHSVMMMFRLLKDSSG